MLINAGVMRATTALLIESADRALAGTAASPAGTTEGTGRASTKKNLGGIDLDNGCDDGLGGRGLWVGSKIATGATLAPQIGIEWRGLYAAIGELSSNRGVVNAAERLNNVSSVAFAVVNVSIFLGQVVGRNASAEMDGPGPLVRTKTTDADGSARRITLSIDHGTLDPEVQNAPNCVLAVTSAIGNNAQIPTGAAAGVIVRTEGATGFASGLAAGDSYVLFGPDTFQIEQTADANGRIVVPVQGRRQRVDRSDSTRTVEREFGVFFEASLEPVEASQIARAFADDILCLGSLATGQGTGALAECQNALIDILRQFRWDIGEFMFPLQDWGASGWRVHGFIDPYEITGVKCDGIGGLWLLNLLGSVQDGVIDAVLDADMDADSGTGPFTIDGYAYGGGVSVPVRGTGTVTFVQTGAETSQLIIDGSINGRPRGGGTLDLVADDCE